MKNINIDIMACIKYIIIFLLFYIGYLYFTRPELEVTPEIFKKIVISQGYKVYKYPIKGVKTSYKAIKKDKTTKEIYYALYNNEKESYNVYTKIMNSEEEKHSLNITKSVRLGKATAEKQTYFYYDNFHIGIYSKNSVIYASSDVINKDDLENTFNLLFTTSENNFQNYIMEKLGMQ